MDYKVPEIDQEMIRRVIREAIDERGMVDKVVAERAGMTSQSLSQFLCGYRKLTATEFIALGRVLDVTPEDVLKESQRQQQDEH